MAESPKILPRANHRASGADGALVLGRFTATTLLLGTACFAVTVAADPVVAVSVLGLSESEASPHPSPTTTETP